MCSSIKLQLVRAALDCYMSYLVGWNTLKGLLVLCDGAILHNRPQIASDCTIHEKSHNS